MIQYIEAGVKYGPGIVGFAGYLYMWWKQHQDLRAKDLAYGMALAAVQYAESHKQGISDISQFIAAQLNAHGFDGKRLEEAVTAVNQAAAKMGKFTIPA